MTTKLQPYENSSARRMQQSDRKFSFHFGLIFVDTYIEFNSCCDAIDTIYQPFAVLTERPKFNRNDALCGFHIILCKPSEPRNVEAYHENFKNGQTGLITMALASIIHKHSIIYEESLYESD